jgi:hypothetical protein
MPTLACGPTAHPKVSILNFAAANCSPFTVAVGGTEAVHFLRLSLILGTPISRIAAHQFPIQDRNREKQFLVP